jgi:hypothetical protein
LHGHAVDWLASVPLCALLVVGKESARFWVFTRFLVGTAVVCVEIKEINLPITYDPARPRYFGGLSRPDRLDVRPWIDF